MPQISIIIPAYNAALYIIRCLDSVLAQTFKDFEVIVVDDGSTDETREILDRYQRADVRVRVIHQENSGVSSARNEGIKVARGEWLYFCDADDELVSPEGLGMLWTLADGHDMAVASHYAVDENGNRAKAVQGVQKLDATLSAKDYTRWIFTRRNGIGYQGYLWNKLFKHSIVNDNQLRFAPEIRFAEDMLFIIQYICCAEVKSIRVNNEVKVYKYYDSPEGAMASLSRSYNPKFFTDFLAFERIAQLVRETYDDDELSRMANYRMCFSGCANLNMMKQFCYDDPKKKEYILLRLKDYPEMKAENETHIAFNWMRKGLGRNAPSQKAASMNDFMHSPECHFRYLGRKWKVAYILSMLFGERGLRPLISKLNTNI